MAIIIHLGVRSEWPQRQSRMGYWRLNGKAVAVRTECPRPWLQDHLSTHQTVPKVQQECQPPANITMQNLTSQKVVAASLYILPDPRPESTRGYAHQPPEQHKHTSTQDGPSIQHTQQKHTREPRTTASQSPSGLVVSHLERILAFLPLESLKPRYTQELWTSEQPAGQAPPPPPGWRAESAPSWRRLPQTWGLSSGPSHSLSTALLTLQQGKAGDLGGETAF